MDSPLAAKRSRRRAPAHDRFPSIAIVSRRRPWLPDQATEAGQSMTLAACKVTSIAILSKRSAALASVSNQKRRVSRLDPQKQKSGGLMRPWHGPRGHAR
jgi:heme exporter protein D